VRKGLQLKRMVRVAIASAALSGTLLVSGCGNADVAATFDGHTVTEGEVDAAVKEINEAFQPQQPYTADNALSALIRAPLPHRLRDQAGQAADRVSRPGRHLDP
jgi:hypothetical protein